MGIETARRVRDQVREGLAELIRLVNDPATPIADVREVLAGSKALGAQVSVLQANAAVLIATRERHGDSGVGVLARSAGLSRRDAAGQVQTARSLQSMPAVRDAVETGQVSVANAKTLARASAKTSAGQVNGDAELLDKAAEMSVEQFGREAGRWAIKRQADGGEGEYRRQRAQRRLSVWDGDDGMVHLRGELDPVTGAKVRKRFLLEAERLRRVDLHSSGGQKRSLNQRMADSLDTLTEHGSIYSKSGSATPGGRGRGGAGANDGHGVRKRDSASKEDLDGVSQTATGGDASGKTSQASEAVNLPESAGLSQTGGFGDGGDKCGGVSRPSADITIVQHLSADGTAAFAEIAGGGVIPPSVLEEYFCGARIKGVVFSREGLPLWHSHAKRLATKAQMSALRTRYGACGGCGADMWMCQGHHIKPVSQGGTTDIDNMMLLCWACHQKVHHHSWRVVPDGRGLYAIAPPERIRYGPAHAPDPPSAHEPPAPRAAKHRGAGSIARAAPDRTDPADGPSARAHQTESLFTLA